MLLPSSGGMTKDDVPRSKLRSGTSGAGLGGSSLKGLPLASVSVSVSGLNESFPASEKATTISGLAMKFIVVGWPSLRMGKLRLYDVTIVLGVADASLERRHWPIHGPQAFASTVALTFCSEA